MKSKTINNVISKKMEDWFKSIEDENVRKLAKANTIVTGGCIASMLLKEDINDFDVYFRNRETGLAVAQYYIDRFKIKNKKGIEVPLYIDKNELDRVKIIVKSAGIVSEEGSDKPYQYFESRPDEEADSYVNDLVYGTDAVDKIEEQEDEASKVGDGPKYRPVFMSSNAITLSHKIQLVMRFYGEPEEIHGNYDFIHCTNYWTSWDNGKLHLNQPALEALLARELKYVGSKYPLCSIIRTRKFIKRGWTINAGQYLKMALNLNEFNLKDPEVLQEQLVGVDAAYFAQLIQRVNERDPDKIDNAYIIEIVDRLF